MSRKKRLNFLCTIIQENKYSNQKELAIACENAGFVVTQPTLSRDLNDLNVEKHTDERGQTYYVLPNSSDEMVARRKERISQSFGFLSFAYSGNIMVLKTLHGYANGLAAELDEQNIPEVLGSLAGDDTVLLVLTENVDREMLNNRMKELIPHFESKVFE